jgi:hypothetical protein
VNVWKLIAEKRHQKPVSPVSRKYEGTNCIIFMHA